MEIKRLENGDYEVNGKIIKSMEAYDLFHYMAREYHVEDIKNKLNDLVEDDRISEELAEDEKFIDAAVGFYERNINNDDGWNYLADNAIEWAKKDFEKKAKGKEDTERI